MKLSFSRLGGAIVAIVTGLVFVGVLQAGFLRWDDNVELTNNPHLRALDWEAIRWMFTDTTYVWRYQPLCWLGWFVTYTFAGLNPFWYHFGNWTMHIGSAVLFYSVLLQVGRRLQIREGQVVASALLASLLWAIHPLRVEPVAWATGRLYDQAAFFFLLALLLYLHAEDLTRPWKSPAYYAALGAFACSLLSYPAGLGFPFVLVLLAWWLRDPAQKESKSLIGAGLGALPFLLVAGVVLAMALLARFFAGGDWPAPASLSEFTPLQRAAQAAYIWLYYAWRFFWPFGLSPLYLTLIQVEPLQPRFLVGPILTPLITLVLLRQRQRWPGLTAAWLAHLFLLAPHLGLTEKPHFPSDRYSYIEGLVWCAMVFGWLARAGAPRFRVLAVTAALLVCGAISTGQTGIWRNNDTFFSFLLEQLGSDPYRYDIYYRQGIVAEEAKHLREAERHYIDALQIRTNFSDARWRLGNVYYVKGRYAKAIEQYTAALTGKPRSAELHNTLGDALTAAGNTNLALDHYEAAVDLNPSLVAAQNNLAIALAERGRVAEAEKHFREVIRLTPREPSAHVNLGVNLRSQGKTNEARQEFEEAQRLRSYQP